MINIKESLLLIGKSSICGGNGFPLSLSEWSFTICLTPYNRKWNVLNVSLNKTFLPSILLTFLFHSAVTCKLTGQSPRTVMWLNFNFTCDVDKAADLRFSLSFQRGYQYGYKVEQDVGSCYVGYSVDKNHLAKCGEGTHTNSAKKRYTLDIPYPSIKDEGYWWCKLIGVIEKSNIVFLDVQGKNSFPSYGERWQ